MNGCQQNKTQGVQSQKQADYQGYPRACYFRGFFLYLGFCQAKFGTNDFLDVRDDVLCFDPRLPSQLRGA